MNVSDFLSRLGIYAVIGAVLGTLVGLVLLALDVTDNPFWATAVGIFVGAMIAPVRGGDA
jgi:hypothetical protein